jgi:hypothetical protein
VKVSELIGALVQSMTEDGDREVVMSISAGPERSSEIEVAAQGGSFFVFLRDEPTGRTGRTTS